MGLTLGVELLQGPATMGLAPNRCIVKQCIGQPKGARAVLGADQESGNLYMHNNNPCNHNGMISLPHSFTRGRCVQLHLLSYSVFQVTPINWTPQLWGYMTISQKVFDRGSGNRGPCYEILKPESIWIVSHWDKRKW